jgi:DNA-directed RNA polymerase specialized sigma subunit
MQEAIEELKRYYPTLQSIEIKTNQIKMIESQLDLINSKENIEMLRNRKKELRAEIKASEIFCEYVQGVINSLCNKDKMVLTEFFLEGKTASEAVESLLLRMNRFEPSSVYRSRKKAIENYAKATKKCK